MLVLTVMFERSRVNVVGVELDRGWLRWTRGLYREVHQVGGRKPPISAPPGTAALPARAVARSEKLVVVELVAASPSVALVLGHRVRDRLVHVDVHLGAQHGHVVTWEVNTGQPLQRRQVGVWSNNFLAEERSVFT